MPSFERRTARAPTSRTTRAPSPRRWGSRTGRGSTSGPARLASRAGLDPTAHLRDDHRMTQIGMTDEMRALRARMKDFIDHVVFPAEAELEREIEDGLHAETGLPLELYTAAKARGDDPKAGVRGPGTDVAARRSTGRMAELKAEAKRRGLWALGHPASIGGGGLPFMDFVYLNEIIGRSEFGQVAVGSVSMQDSIMLDLYASAEQR